MMFRVGGGAAEPDRLIKVRRPFAQLRRPGRRRSTIAVDDRAVSAPATSTSTSTPAASTPSTWSPAPARGSTAQRAWSAGSVPATGSRSPAAGSSCSGSVSAGRSSTPPRATPTCCADSPTRTRLVGVTLEPRRSDDTPWVLGSELVFLGWSASCGIQVKDTSVARTHCALLRTATAAYLVDLCGRQTWVEDRAVRGASALRDGDLITIGSTQFTARIDPPPRPPSHSLQVVPRDDRPPPSPATTAPTAGPPGRPFPAVPLAINPDLVPAEAQGALLAWMMGTIQGSQGEVLRRQGEFQLAMTEVLRQIQQDSATLLNAHLRRIESIDHEIAALRARARASRNARPGPPPPPDVAPLRISRPAPARRRHPRRGDRLDHLAPDPRQPARRREPVRLERPPRPALAVPQGDLTGPRNSLLFARPLTINRTYFDPRPDPAFPGDLTGHTPRPFRPPEIGYR